jgi:hypothetical protein
MSPTEYTLQKYYLNLYARREYENKVMKVHHGSEKNDVTGALY